MRLGLLPMASLLVACASAPPLSMTCTAVPSGTGLAAAIELRNDGDAAVTLEGNSLPWAYRHAAHFEAAGFSDPNVVVEPEPAETVILLPGETTGGEVALADRLVDGFGRSIEALPGEHEVEMTARLALDPETPRRRSHQVRCTFDLTVAPP